MLDAAWTLLVGHIKSNDEQLCRAAEGGIAPASRILDQCEAQTASIGINADGIDAPAADIEPDADRVDGVVDEIPLRVDGMPGAVWAGAGRNGSSPWARRMKSRKIWAGPLPRGRAGNRSYLLQGVSP